MIELEDVEKTFVMHLRGGVRLPVVRDVSFSVGRGECVVLGGPSGIGKSSILKMIYGNYRAVAGRIRVRGPQGWLDVAQAPPREILALRHSTIGYVSQFLRTIPRIVTFDIVAAAARESGRSEDWVRDRAGDLLSRLNIPERLWSLPPATFSGGEQQRVNIARGDPDIADKVRKVTKRIREEDGTSILYTSHNMRDVEEVCDRILFMHQGRVLFTGTAAEILGHFKEDSLESLFIRVARGGEIEAAVAS